MMRKLDEKMLSGFSRELRGYLTNIRESIERLNVQHDALEQATQGLTTITGALQMIGFTGLSQVTSHLRSILEESLGNQSELDAALRTWLGSTIVQLERNLESILEGQLSEEAFVAEVEHSLSRYKEAGTTTEPPATEIIDTPTEVQDVGPGGEGDTLYVALDEDEHDTVTVEEGESESLEFIEESLVQPIVVETTPASPLPSDSFEEPQEIANDDIPPHVQYTAPDTQNVPGLAESSLHDEPTMSEMAEVGFEDDTTQHAYEADSAVIGEGQSAPVTDTPALEDEALVDIGTDDVTEPATFADSTSPAGSEQVDAFVSAPDEPTLIDEREGLAILSTEEDDGTLVDQSTQIESAESEVTADTLFHGLDEPALSDTSDTIRDSRSEEDVVAGLTDILPTDTIEFVLPEATEEDGHDAAAEQRSTSPEHQEVADSSPDVDVPLSAEQPGFVGGVQERDQLPEISEVSSDDPTLIDVKLVSEPLQATLPPTEELAPSVPEFAPPDEPTLIDATPTFSPPPAWDDSQQDVHTDSPIDAADAETIETPRPELSHRFPDEPTAADQYGRAIQNEPIGDPSEEAGDILDSATETVSTETTLSSDNMSTNDAEPHLPIESAEDYEPCLEPPLIIPQAEVSATHSDSQAGEGETPVVPHRDTVADDSNDMSVLRAATPESETDELPNAETDESFGSEPEETHTRDEFENARIEDDTPGLLPAPPEANAAESFVVPLLAEEEAQSFPEVTDAGDVEPEAVPPSIGSRTDAMAVHTTEAAEWTDIPDETESPDLPIDLLMSEPDDDDEHTDQPTSQSAALEPQESYGAPQESSDEYAINAAVEGEEDSGELSAADDSLPELLFDPTENLEEEHPGEESFVVAPAQVPVASPPVEETTEASMPSDTSGQELSALVEAIDNEVQEAYGQAEVSPDERRAQGELQSSERYLVCTLAGSRYAVGVPHVLEISRVPQLTAVPNVPEWVSGVINLRGEIISVIDLRIFLGLDKSHQPDQSRLLIVKTHDDTLTTSLIVDQINGFVRLPANMMQDLTMSFQSNLDQYLVGISDYEDQVLAVFDLERFLKSSEICQFDVT